MTAVGDLKALLLKLRPQYQIRVRSFCAWHAALNAQLRARVHCFRSQHLMFAGRMLNEDGKSLDSYDVHKGAPWTLTSRSIAEAAVALLVWKNALCKWCAI